MPERWKNHCRFVPIAVCPKGGIFRTGKMGLSRMPVVFALLQCVGQAIVEKGIRGLLDMVPGGAYAYEVSEAAWKRYRERRQHQQIRDELGQLAQVQFVQARQVAEQVAREVAATADAAERIALELYLAQIPATIQQSLKRPADLLGRSVPHDFALANPETLLKLLPQRPPRFRPEDSLPGKPGWILTELLGVGGFGEVWLAQHSRYASLRGAVKFCHALTAAQRHLLHESGLVDRVMAQGRHPHCVPLLDAQLDLELPWVMYEYVVGGDLADRIRFWQTLDAQERFRQASSAFRVIVETVAVFHRLQPAIVHRDLKPSNILWDAHQETLRITDFGIGAALAPQAWEQDSPISATGDHRLSGWHGAYTPLYASPQQREHAAPDPRDDVHALGVLGYQMFTGHLTQGAGPDFADDLREAGVPESWITLLGRCVAQKAERRPRDANELLTLLPNANESLTLLPNANGSPVTFSPLPTSTSPPTSTTWASITADACNDILQADWQRWHDARRTGSTRDYLTQAFAERSALWQQAAIRDQHPLALLLWGDCHLEGVGVPQNYPLALDLLQSAAQAGQADAQRIVALMYLRGWGVSKNAPQALHWLQRAVAQQDPYAWVVMGQLYETGTGVERSFTKAVECYRKAARQEVGEAYHYLASLAERGIGMAKNLSTALGWYRQAAERGFQPANAAVARIETLLGDTTSRPGSEMPPSNAI